MSDTPLTLCPACGYALDQASGRGLPKPGDLSICLSCGALLEFDADVRPSRLAPADALARLSPDMSASVAAAQEHIRRRGPIATRGAVA